MTWRVAKSLLHLKSQVDAARPIRDRSNDGTIGDAAHASRTSDHNPWVKDGSVGVVTAIDITHDPEHGVDTYAFAEHLRQTKDQRTKYIISNRKICSSIVKPWEWRPYTGSNPHDHHIHVSVRTQKSLYDLETDWDLGPLAGSPPTDDIPLTIHPKLKYDSTGPDVARVQQLLGITSEFAPDSRGTIKKVTDAVRGISLERVPWFGPRTESGVKDFQLAHGLVNDGIVGFYTWRELETIGAQQPVGPKVQRNIVATTFGGKKDINKSAYTGKLLNDTDFYVALPYRFIGERPRVMVINRENGKTAIASIEDLGPWNTNDPYWTRPNGRPQAEEGHDEKKRTTNHAGIDLSPALAKFLGIDGKGEVDWSFA